MIWALAQPWLVPTLNVMSTQTLSPQRIRVPEVEFPSDIQQVTTLLVNLYMVGEVGLPDWVLIDAGIPMNAGRIIGRAQERFGGIRPRAIILTHGHFDHVGSLAPLLRYWPGVPVYAHELELPYLTGRSAYPPPDPTVGGGMMARTSPLFPRHAYDFRPHIMALPPDGNVPHMSGWRWIHTPGHTPGHISLFREYDRALIAGDAFVTQEQESLWGVMTRKIVVHGPPTYFTTDWEAAWDSLRRLHDLSPQFAYTGHGQPIANPRLAHHLGLLARDFEQVAKPDDGRYVRHAARSDGRGTVWVPPPVRDLRPWLIGGIALCAAAAGVVYAQARRRRW